MPIEPPVREIINHGGNLLLQLIVFVILLIQFIGVIHFDGSDKSRLWKCFEHSGKVSRDFLVSVFLKSDMRDIGIRGENPVVFL